MPCPHLRYVYTGRPQRLYTDTEMFVGRGFSHDMKSARAARL